MAEIPIGAKREEIHLVTTDVAIDFMGVEGARVLATPWLIMFLERNCRNLLLDYLEEGYDSVGSEVNVKHLAATPIGMAVTFRAEIMSADDRRVMFRVEAEDEKEKVSEGTHERFVVNVNRFASRVQAKSGR